MRQMQDLAPVCYVGRGGAGNKAFVHRAIQRAEASDTDSVKSDSSSDSDAGPINHKLKWGWGKVVCISSPMIGVDIY